MEVLKNINTEKNYIEFLNFLIEYQDLNYRDFNSKIVVIEKSKLIGVRSPILKKIAKSIAKNNYMNYEKVFKKLYKKDKIYFYEEKIIYSLIVSYIKESFENKIKKLDFVIEIMDNWAICDTFVISAKFIKNNKEDFYKYILSKIYSQNTWELRFVLVVLLEYYVEKFYLRNIFDICEKIKNEDYYVKMAKAWLLSMCFLRFKEETYNFLEETNLDKWTVNKSIQKIRESCRISEEDKNKVLVLKRK